MLYLYSLKQTRNISTITTYYNKLEIHNTFNITRSRLVFLEVPFSNGNVSYSGLSPDKDPMWSNISPNQGAGGAGGSAPPDIIEIIDSKMEHFNAIWNANLELQRQVKNKKEHVFLHYLKRFGTAVFFKDKDSKGCILTVFETIWNYREHFKN